MKTPLPLSVEISRGARADVLPRSRALWFFLGVFSALTLAGFVAGIFHLPA